MRNEFLASIIGASILMTGLIATPAFSQSQKVYLTEAQRDSVRRGVRARLKDPQSAQFGGMSAVVDARRTVHVCGFVNARNSYGGYNGDELFYGTFKGGGFTMEMKEAKGEPITRRILLQMCRDLGIGTR